MVFSRKDLKIRIRKPIAKNRLEVFSKNISWEVNHVHAHEVLSNCEVDQELEYVFHLSSYKVIVWVQDGLITIPTTLIIRSHDVGCTHLERHTYMRDDVPKTLTLGG